MNCPECGASGAYTGLQWVHCQSLSCRYYDARYTNKVRKEESDRVFASFLYEKAEKLIMLREQISKKNDVDDV